MSWSQQIFAYCERGTNPAFWAEPLNAISNGAFIMAALFAFLFWQRGPRPGGRLAELGLILLVVIIGIGSFLFHTYATRWAAVADIAPIMLFMLAYLGYAMRRYLAASWWATAATFLAFLLTGGAASAIRCGGGACLNGSLGYAPALLALLLIGGTLAVARHAAAAGLLTAGCVFALSLAFRSLDQSLCAQTLIQPGWRTGTHALWHMLNAVVLYHLLIAALRNGDQLQPKQGIISA